MNESKIVFKSDMAKYVWDTIRAKHQLDSEKCRECPPDNKPERCQCGGLIHCLGGEEPSMAKSCTNCGDGYEYLDSKRIHPLSPKGIQQAREEFINSESR